MSEYQFIVFRAIDAPVPSEHLPFMRQQSTRAKVSAWSFTNVYHYGDFSGDVDEMLRRGYDLYLRYADFGIRELRLRLPRTWSISEYNAPYFEDDTVTFDRDQDGAALVAVSPMFEPGDLPDVDDDFESLLERLAPLRQELITGDLRPLYLAHLAVAVDTAHDPDRTIEAPVPAGLSELTDAQEALAMFLGLSSDLIAAAAAESDPAPATEDTDARRARWLKTIDDSQTRDWLAQVMAGKGTQVQAAMLERCARESDVPPWPTRSRQRTIGQLQAAADDRTRVAQEQAAAEAAHARQRRLNAMAAEPEAWLRKVDKLVDQRSTTTYEQAADLLADMHRALAGTDRPDLAQRHAQKIRQAYPNRNMLIAALRRRDLLAP